MTKVEMKVERVHVPRELRKSRAVPLAAGRCGGPARGRCASAARAVYICVVWRQTQSQRCAREMGTAKKIVLRYHFLLVQRQTRVASRTRTRYERAPRDQTDSRQRPRECTPTSNANNAGRTRRRVDHCTLYSPRKVGSAGPVM